MIPVFPDEHPGSFTYRNRLKSWVWTTFHNYQWDLNYENPAVFNRMLEEMLFLANQGVEILRLDAVAFVWKQLGTDCQNLPEAHTIIQAFNALVRIAAPAMVFKSEAIVHPDEVRKYIDENECQLSYNPQLMALLWNSLATRKVDLLQTGMQRRFAIPDNCAWVNYVRCHDDIGFAFSNDDLRDTNNDPAAHRRFLADFFTGRFPGSFARGLPFQQDPVTGEARISGTCASLTGVEQGLEENDAHRIELAIQRILLLHGIILTIGGIPLIYLGDEIGMLNDYGYENDAEKTGDSRWLHRAAFDWTRAEARRDPGTIPGRIYQDLLRLIQIRQQNPALDRAETEIVESGNAHVFAYFRTNGDYSVLVLANFSETPQPVEGKHLRLLGLRKSVVDLVAGRTIIAAHTLEMEPYDFMILARPAGR
jgi:amylosucrase/maltose alpha-D-glucosyltransferase/alpha-amylase